MKTAFSTVFFITLSLALFSQHPSSDFGGKIKIADDASSPANGSIRYNDILKKFEGYIDGNWIDLSGSCSCPYVTKPFTSLIDNVNITAINNKVQLTIEFSHVMETSSFIYGTNVHIAGTGVGTPISSGGTLTWSNGNTRLRIETIESYFNLSPTCLDGVTLTIRGSGVNPVRGKNTSIMDGDRDGCCGGDYIVRFGIIC